MTSIPASRRARDDLGAAGRAVEPWLGDQDADLAGSPDRLDGMANARFACGGTRHARPRGPPGTGSRSYPLAGAPRSSPRLLRRVALALALAALGTRPSTVQVEPRKRKVALAYAARLGR